jgi:hypothetical protein
MAIVAGGIVTLKPVGGLVTSNPNGLATQTPEQQQAKQEEKQAKVDALVNKVAQQNQKRWSVPFK